jgi:hypothetical protein
MYSPALGRVDLELEAPLSQPDAALDLKQRDRQRYSSQPYWPGTGDGLASLQSAFATADKMQSVFVSRDSVDSSVLRVRARSKLRLEALCREAKTTLELGCAVASQCCQA